MNKSQDKRQSQSKLKIKTEQDFMDNILDLDISKPGSAYNYYTREMMAKNKIPKLTDASSQFAPKWKKMSESDKQKYEKMREADEVRYREHLDICKRFLVNSDDVRERTSPYMMFKIAYVADAIARDVQPAEARKQAKGAWEKLKDSDRKKFEDEFEKNKALMKELHEFNPGRLSAYNLYVRDQCHNHGMSFKEAGANWKAGKVPQKQIEKYEKYAEEENRKKERLVHLWEISNGVKPKKPLGAFKLFLRDLGHEDKLKGNKNSFKTAIKLFEGLSKDRKEEYDREAKKEQLYYTLKLAEYSKHVTSRVGKAPTAFNLYVQDKAPQYEKDDLDAGEMFTMVAKAWKNESANVRSKYEKQAEAAIKELAEYREKIKGGERPARNLTAYTHFVREKFADYKKKNSSKQANEIFEIMAKDWKKMDSKSREHYESVAQKDKIRYEEEIREFEQKYGIRGRTDSTQRLYTDQRRSKSLRSMSGLERLRDSQNRGTSQPKTKSKSKSRKSKSKSKKSTEKVQKTKKSGTGKSKTKSQTKSQSKKGGKASAKGGKTSRRSSVSSKKSNKSKSKGKGKSSGKGKK